jgi:PilZ domain
MDQEINEGTAYLMALKQSRQSDAGPQEPEANPQSNPSLTATNAGDGFQGAEKRRAPRYKCEGSAQVREEGCDVHTWVTFTDVSIHGCYVEAQATYPPDTLLHMRLEANGFRVEAKGKVRVSYPYLGMGIAFEEISEENLSQLKRMLATLSHPAMIMGPGIASSLPATSPLDAVPLITNPQAAIQALTEFFESHQILMRDDFLKVLKKSQK